jgi:hypothetical protein
MEGKKEATELWSVGKGKPSAQDEVGLRAVVSLKPHRKA